MIAAGSVPLPASPTIPIQRVIKGGLLAGVIDISYVMFLWVLVLKKTTAMRIWQSVATGLLGKDAFQGGLPTAILGGLLHFTIAMTWTVIYWQVYRRSSALRRMSRSTGGAIAAGMLYGACIWLAMNFVVLTLSKATYVPVTAWQFWANLAQHAIMIGPTITLLVRER
ncbi:MAG: hypothetical protein ABI613_10580 [Gemmatimonadota bacterium]